MKPLVLWFIGLSGAGKSTLAQALAEQYSQAGYKVELLDGDAVRAKNPGLGFGREQRLAHLKVVAQQAAELESKGSIVIGAFITPYESARNYLRTTCARYVEVWVDTELGECERRDVKGLYAKARRGELTQFTGISDVFEEPITCDIRLKTKGKSVEESLKELTQSLARFS